MKIRVSEAPRGKPWGIFAELRRSHNDEPAVAKAMAGRLAIHPRGKPRGILAKASRGRVFDRIYRPARSSARDEQDFRGAVGAGTARGINPKYDGMQKT